MKIAAMIARYLLGLVFLVFGSNDFLHFIPMQPMPGVAGQFIGAMVVSHYIGLIGATEVIGGLLLLAGRYVRVGLLILAPVIVNILAFHATMQPQGLPVALIVAALWLLVFFRDKALVRDIFASKILPD